ncbi:hypothetical protein PTSG_09296 [Salpingoeca rosetta]|uniref:AH domain-containing protein n=1 Tax=Salpingoeca rosetta (strain ATCC 50818 / BSB-021) TaxID=946362 RepID=F2UM80_SALR5|nr:uncharacterized protein PTSG_09296 [Salpingoeca rosetta]EGD78229.1 hypothetical protein PTSG_09296 [Salpingoeca rosetta]|eukprot:XP_004989552.1 hypothetical protein PTSG_09296 [Salpingoeca rosetta]
MADEEQQEVRQDQQEQQQQQQDAGGEGKQVKSKSKKNKKNKKNKQDKQQAETAEVETSTDQVDLQDDNDDGNDDDGDDNAQSGNTGGKTSGNDDAQPADDDDGDMPLPEADTRAQGGEASAEDQEQSQRKPPQVVQSISSWWSKKAKPNLMHLKDDVSRELTDSGRKLRILRQRFNESLGYGDRTVDLELQPRIEMLLKRQKQYHAMAEHVRHLIATVREAAKVQAGLGSCMAAIADLETDLAPHFSSASRMQDSMSGQAGPLVEALEFFRTQTLGVADGLAGNALHLIQQHNSARLEYDAFRSAYEKAKAQHSPRTPVAEQKFLESYTRLDSLRADVVAALDQFDSQRCEVMRSQLQALMTAVGAFMSGNDAAVSTALAECKQHPAPATPAQGAGDDTEAPAQQQDANSSSE